MKIKMKNKVGFTLLEVSLFLALTGLLVMGIVSSTNRSLSRQRYNNSVDTFQDFLEGLYRQVSYSQSANGNGRTTEAIYGRLAVFGQDENSSTVHIYSVIGDALSSKDVSILGNTSTLKALDFAKADIFNQEGEIIEESTYEPKWGAEIEGGEENILMQKSLLIVRSPISGSISTFVLDGQFDFQQPLKYYLPAYDPNSTFNRGEMTFETKDINFCLNSDEKWAAGNFRRNIRIKAGGHNSSAIELISDSEEGNPCA